MTDSFGDPRAGQSPDDARAARIRAGDRDAFEQFVKAHYAALAAFACRVTLSHAMAEDVVQDVLFRLWQRRDTLPGDAEIVPYTFGAVRRRAIDVVRQSSATDARLDRLAHELAAAPPSAPNLGEEQLAHNELRQVFDRVVAELPPRCREIFLLNRTEGLSYAQVAEQLGLSVHTVHVQMGRALKRLHETLRDWGPVVDRKEK